MKANATAFAAAAWLLCSAAAYARQPWVVLKDCRLLRSESTDADSFHVKAAGEEYIFRLYFVDARETDMSIVERVREQAQYLNGLARVHGAEAQRAGLRSPERAWDKLKRLEREARQLKVGAWGASSGRMAARTPKPPVKGGPNAFDHFLDPDRIAAAPEAAATVSPSPSSSVPRRVSLGWRRCRSLARHLHWAPRREHSRLRGSPTDPGDRTSAGAAHYRSAAVQHG